MDTAEFLELARLVPDAMLLLTDQGEILGANAQARQHLSSARDRIEGCSLIELTVDPPARLLAYLRSCARSGEPLPGALHVRREGEPAIKLRAWGSRAGRVVDDPSPRIVLRIQPAAEAGAAFALLDRKLDELGRESRRRVAAETELEEREAQLCEVMARIGDAVIVTDAAGGVLLMNAVAQALTGWPEDEAKGRPVGEIYRRDGPGVLLDRRGARIPVDERAATSGGAAGVVVFREITERDRAERERRLQEEQEARVRAQQAAARLTQLQALTAALSRSRRVADVAAATLAHGPSLLGAIGAAFWVLGPSGATLELVEQFGVSPPLFEQMRSIPLSDARIVTAIAARTGQPQWIDSPDDLAQRAPAPADPALASGLRALAALPLSVDGRLVGAFSMAFPGRRRLNDGERSFALTFADQCAQALDRALAHARDERAAQLSARVQQVTAALSEARTPDEVAAVAITHGCAAFGASRGLLGLRSDDGATLELPQWFAYPLTEAVRTEQALFFESAEAVLRRHPQLAGRMEPGARALAAIPLSAHGRTLGALGLVFDAPRPFDEEDRAAMRALGERCAEALDRARLYAEAARARAAAEDANRAKDEFLSVLSHELRTPLTAVLGWANLLRTRNPEPPALERGLATIERNSKLLVQLIEDLLDVSRIVAGKVRLEIRPLDPALIVRAAVEVVRPAADVKRIALETAIDDAAGPLFADPSRLQQIAWNLLSNAVKFTPEGGRIEVRLERQREAVVLCVSDSGVGIDPGFLPHVFERFRQGDATPTRPHTGLGLGLAIAEHLVALHGGTITAESDGIGCGATFTVELPTAPRTVESPRERASTDPVTPVSRRLDGVTVVVVDDEADTRELLAVILQGQGASVTVAASAAEALRAIEIERPDVLVSDIGMPDEDGYALLRKAHALTAAQGRTLPALALTAFAGAHHVRLAELAGFQRHLAKPVSAGAVIAAVAQLAGRA